MSSRKPRIKPLHAVGITLGVLLAAFFAWHLTRSTPPEVVEPAVVVEAPATPTPSFPVTLHRYMEIVESCNWAYGGDCVNLRSGPGTEHPVVMPLRNYMVFKIASTTVRDGRTWYKIGFDGGIRYSERLKGDWYVAGDFVRMFSDEGTIATTTKGKPINNKRIVVDRTEKKLYAYEGDTVFMEEAISVGLDLTPTPRGNFRIFRKMPSSYMQGPLPGISEQYYDLPGVPWTMYFTEQGGAIHGAYWHENFGRPWSHGCVNVSPEKARLLYEWADLGTPVLVKN